MFSIQKTPLDLAALRSDIQDPTCGALVVFEGLVRNHHEGRDVTQLHYAHHPVLAQKEGERILAETMAKFAITKSVAIHRVGTLAIGECAVVTLTTSPHREAAFEANRFLIDSIKARVPIWKQETYSTGEVEWTSPCPNCGPVPH
ncbi:MAG: molybdenum cofactor biosynthesis protein MoaE [Akkermansiaceae bacterium]|nr:molybdenum cofactor biosynthesis protein MoaE [Akkermansiaceae bacterium]